MNRSESRGPFTLRRTFTIGPALQRSAAPAVKPPPSQSCTHTTHLQRTRSAPVFTRRPVTSIHKAHAAAAFRDVAVQAPLPPCPSPQIRRWNGQAFAEQPTVGKHTRIATHRFASAQDSFHIPRKETPSTSPDPRAPPATASAQLQSLASSIHSGGVGAAADASFSSKWYPAWAASPPSLQEEVTKQAPPSFPDGPAPSRVATNIFHVLEKSAHAVPLSDIAGRSGAELQPATHLCTAGSAAAVDCLSTTQRTPTRRCGAAGDVSSLFPASLGHTMPPPKRTKSRRATQSTTHGGPCVSEVCVRVESCTGLPRAPFSAEGEGEECVKDSQPVRSGETATTRSGNAVYVYMKSNHGGVRYKSPSLPYAVAVDFTHHLHDFYVPLHGENEAEEDEVLTFTVAVRFPSGKQVKLGVGRLAVCNLYEGESTCIPMPIVAKAGTVRARERGVLTVSLRVRGTSWLPRNGPHSPLDEAVVRSRVWAVMRRACRAQLDQAEVYVRRHCRDSAAELQRFLQRMECGTLLPQKRENVAVPVGCNDTAVEEKTQLCRARHPATSAPSAGRQSSSSVFTSCVLDDVHGVRSTASCPRNAQVDDDARQHRRRSPRRSATVGCGKEESHKQPLSKTKIKTAETSVPVVSQKSPKQAQDANEVAELFVRVTVCSVRNLRGEHGLPRHDCASCFVRALVVDDKNVRDHKTSVKSSAASLTDFATETAAYGDDGAVFDEEGILLAVPLHLAQPVLRCSVLCGSKALHLELGSCNVSLKSLLDSDGWMSEKAGTYVLVNDAGSPLGYPCGELKLSLQRVTESDRGSCVLFPETHTTQKETSMVLARRAAVERRVLSYLWHNRRNELHRLDNFVEDACAVGFDNAVARRWAPAKGPTSPSPPRVSRNAVRVTIHAAALSHQGENSGSGNSPTLPEDARVPRLNFAGVYIAWSCGCFAGRVNIGDCVDALPSTIHLGETLPLLEDVDVYRDELCFAFYGTAIAPSATAGNAALHPVELCRTHVSLRSFPACSARSPAEVVQLPLVWHAGERGAYEGGYLSVAVNVAANDSSSSSSSSSASDVKSTAASSEFRTAPWKGFQIDWPPRVAVVQLLRCYATDQLHRILPLLADAEGNEEALVHRLQATYGTTATPVELRICLVGFRCHCPDYQACCLKVYHRDVNQLRTPTFSCSPPTHAFLALLPPNNCDKEKACTVPLLDEDKYLFRVSTTAPQRERVVIKMAVEHLLRHSDVVASAELSLAAFVSLESRLAASLHQPSSTRHTFSSPRSPMWVPLCSSSGGIVGEVAVRVEWQHRTFLAPVRRVTTHKKCSVAAVLRTSQMEGRGRGSGTGNESLPLYDAHTMRDISSLVSAYAARDLCRLTSYLSRWADATKAHARLRSQLLSPLHVATVYVDVAGLALSMQDGGRASGDARGGELSVSALCLGASSPRPVVCPLLPADAARATEQAAAVFRAIDRAAEDVYFTSHRATLRLDLQLPTVDGVDADLNLVFLSSSSSSPSTTAVGAVPSSLPSQRALSAPRCGRGKTSSKLLHQLRSRSAAVAAALLPTAKQKAGVPPFNHDTRPDSQTAEIGRVALSLRALLTTPDVYHDRYMVTVPVVHLVDSGAGDDTAQRTKSRSVVVGNVCLRVRTPAHEPPPAWLRFSDAEVQRINQCGRLTRKDVQSRLRERLRREAEEVKPDVHAAFFRTCAGSPEPQCTRRAQTAHCGAEDRRQRVLAPPRPPPMSPQPTPLHSTFATLAVPREESFHVQAVRTRSQGSVRGAASVAELDDFSTPRKDSGAAARHEWSSEQGGVTLERSSAAAKSTCEKDATSSSSLLRVRHVSAQRVLFA